jgi:Leucine-rich repeat (LRR) protein
VIEAADPPVFESSPKIDIRELKRILVAGSDLPEAWIPLINKLRIGGTRLRDLTPMFKLVALEHLGFPNTRVGNLEPIESLKQLECLDCSRTHVADLGPIASLTRLRRLEFSDTRVDSLKPIAKIAPTGHRVL